MQVSKQVELDYGHTLPNHYSFCNQIHGHRAKVVITVEGEVSQNENDSSQGMVFDFKILKELMMELIHDELDHGFAVWKDDSKDLEFIKGRNSKVLITDVPPTAECLAEWAYNQLLSVILLKYPNELSLVKVEWWETPNSCAIYEGSK